MLAENRPSGSGWSTTVTRTASPTSIGPGDEDRIGPDASGGRDGALRPVVVGLGRVAMRVSPIVQTGEPGPARDPHPRSCLRRERDDLDPARRLVAGRIGEGAGDLGAEADG